MWARAERHHATQLTNSWISKASATQRAGRTGREPGPHVYVYKCVFLSSQSGQHAVFSCAYSYPCCSMSTCGSYCSFVGSLDRLATHGSTVLVDHKTSTSAGACARAAFTVRAPTLPRLLITLNIWSTETMLGPMPYTKYFYATNTRFLV